MTVINSRRLFLASSLGAVFWPKLMVASEKDVATQIVYLAVHEINQIINSGNTEEQMLKSFEGVFNEYADVPTIAKYALGRDARTASATQLKDYTKASQLTLLLSMVGVSENSSEVE